MKGILIVSHHTLATAFVETIEMITGKREFLKSLGLEEGVDPKFFGKKILDSIREMKNKGCKDVIVFVDLYGGTPCNQAILLLEKCNIQVIAGVNLPMLLHAVLSNNKEIDLKEYIEMAVLNGKDGIYDVVKKYNLNRK